MLHDLVQIQAKGAGRSGGRVGGGSRGRGGKERGYPVEVDKNPTDLRALPLAL